MPVKRFFHKETSCHWWIFCCVLFSDGKSSVTLGQILIFLTGADEPPPCGFIATPQLCFCDMERLPEASTCSLTLTLSRSYKDYALFKEKMDFAISNGYGFGKL